MKKIALLLALALALSCCLLMLASCSEDEGDTSSAAATSSGGTSSAAASSAAASSKAEESSKAEGSSEPEEESSEEPGFEKNPDATPNEDGANLALGASYVTSQLYRQGDADKDWGWDEDAKIAYPDDDGDLTDGAIGEDDPELENEYQNPAWVGFHAKAPDYLENGYSYFTVDLGDVYELSRLVVYVGTKALGGGIYVPASVEFLVSEDGENFVSVGTVVPVDDEGVPYSETTLECDVTGQYVQVRMTCAGWMFVSEFEAY